MSRYQTDPEYRERVKERARKRYWNTPGVREAQLAAQAKAWASDPEYRDKQNEYSRSEKALQRESDRRATPEWKERNAEKSRNRRESHPEEGRRYDTPQK